MKQVIQSFKSGELTVSDVPLPILRPEGILVRTAASLVSAGTERMVVDFAESNLLQKAQARPDLVRQVLDKVQREGLLSTIDGVLNRLEQPLPLGYSSAGIVLEVGAEATGFQAGDRVACAGGGYASHAEQAYVPHTLAVPLPENVSFEHGAFSTLGAIALQGIRQANVELGHNVLVIGLGLIGQLAVQMLKAAGCQVFGIDLDPQRVEMAREMGADEAHTNDAAEAKAHTFTGGRGFDAVLITAATRSNDPVELAGVLARDRAIVVAVGAVGLNIPRKIYYDKELDLRLSRSYGPGRYDPNYEEKGHDYPYGYVRWTEQRNMEAFLQLVADGSVRLDPLITHRFSIDDAIRAYDLITGKAGEPSLGIVLTYDLERHLAKQVAIAAPEKSGSDAHSSQASIQLGMVGAGNFVKAALLPAMRGLPGLELQSIVSGSGVNAQSAAKRFGFSYCTSEMEELLADEHINWLAIATRHNLHADQAVASLQAGKDTYVEKPLALNREELVRVIRAQEQSGKRLMVGFNRRFAPMVKTIKERLARHSSPLTMIYRCNAGMIPAEHWTQDPNIGGGRIIGEACHFVDLLQFFVDAPPVKVYANAVKSDQGLVEDEAIITLAFADGSVGTVIYTAGGDKSFSKERIELLGGGLVAALDDFRSLELILDGKRVRQKEYMRPDKGLRGEWEALLNNVSTGAATPIRVDEIVATHLATFAAVESLRSGNPVTIDYEAFWTEVQG